MRCVIVTGMSGAGKSTALKFFEDIGFFCVDNFPPSLLGKIAEICSKPGSDIDGVAFGVDIRGRWMFKDLLPELEKLKQQNIELSVLFLDASDETLVKRYKETRRSHPLARKGDILSGIASERAMLEEVKLSATYIIDTSHILTRELKEQINAIFLENKSFNSLMITVLSFGYKFGIPSDADLVFDVRFLPNPFYIDKLKEMTGNDPPVRDYVMGWEAAEQFLGKLVDMVEFLIPNYVKEGKNQLVIAIGCTGGKHRSVTLANELYAHLYNDSLSVSLMHRDISRR